MPERFSDTLLLSPLSQAELRLFCWTTRQNLHATREAAGTSIGRRRRQQKQRWWANKPKLASSPILATTEEPTGHNNTAQTCHGNRFSWAGAHSTPGQSIWLVSGSWKPSGLYSSSCGGGSDEWPRHHQQSGTWSRRSQPVATQLINGWSIILSRNEGKWPKFTHLSDSWAAHERPPWHWSRPDWAPPSWRFLSDQRWSRIKQLLRLTSIQVVALAEPTAS